MFYTGFQCTMSFLHHRGAPIKSPMVSTIWSFPSLISSLLICHFLSWIPYTLLSLKFLSAFPRYPSVSFYAGPALLHLLAARLKMVEAVGLFASCPALPARCQIVTWFWKLDASFTYVPMNKYCFSVWQVIQSIIRIYLSSQQSLFYYSVWA